MVEYEEPGQNPDRPLLAWFPDRRLKRCRRRSGFWPGSSYSTIRSSRRVSLCHSQGPTGSALEASHILVCSRALRTHSRDEQARRRLHQHLGSTLTVGEGGQPLPRVSALPLE